MKFTGSYSKTEDEFDIDHEINDATSHTKGMIKEILATYKESDAKLIIKAIISEYIDAL